MLEFNEVSVKKINLCFLYAYKLNKTFFLFKTDIIFLYETFLRNFLLDFDLLRKFVLKASIHLTFKELTVLVLRTK